MLRLDAALHQNTYRVIPGFMNAVTDSDGRYEITDIEAWDQEAQEKARRQPRKQVAPGEKSESPEVVEEREFKRYTHGRGLVRHPDLPLRGFTFAKVPGTCDITLPRPAKLEGRVTFQDSSQPAAKATVEVIRNPTGDDTHWREVFETDADGRYSVTTKLLPGTYEIKARLTGWPQVVSSGLQLKAGPNTADIKLQAGATIQGRVIEVSTGKPVPFVPGSFSLVMAGNLATRTESDYVALGPDGKFSLMVLPGGTLISVRSLGTFDGMRWMLVGNNRQAVQVVHVAKGETKELELRLLRAASMDGDFMDRMDDEQEQSAQIQQLLNPEAGNASPKKPTQNVAEQAAVAAIEQLGGMVKTDTIEGRECVVEVNMVEPEVPGEAVDEQLFTDAGLKHLHGLKNLQQLDLPGSAVTPAGLEELRKVLPKLKAPLKPNAAGNEVHITP